ncbi:MAG TPA: protein kinase [Blastocatellia bacterium]|nr:protein kinase [Blastocatellia bacterium]
MSEHDDRDTLAIGPGVDSQSWSMPTSFASGRYLVRRPLGQGGQKKVYLARDDRLDRDVVIALLKTDQLGADSVPRLIREAQAMARLGSHPNIVTVYDIGDEDGRPFIVSQYVEGGSVADLLKSADNHRLSFDQVIRIGSQICHALVHCHSQGIIHRDLKPGNVWLSQDGTAKLGDFGLAVSADFSRITLEGALVGTVVYMPPELMLGHQAEPRSDLYSLGVMLYEVVTGRPPFMGDQFVAIISQHINSAPVAPSWHNPEVPQALETLILRLLAKSPEERPESAAEVSKTLAAIASSSPELADRAIPHDAKSLSRLAGGVFIGREQETKELRVALNETLAGKGHLFMLVGEPGSGKTRMTEQLATYARLCNAQVLIGRCYEGEGAPAFWPWLQIVRSYAQEMEPEKLLSTMGPGAADIAQVVSEIKERLPDLPAPPPLEPEQARFRLFDSVTTFLKNASKLQSLVVILDDLHWADKPSLLLLQFLARELKDASILVIGTYRDMELGRQHPLSQTLGELSRQGLSARIVLRGLTEQDVARFIEMTTGIKPQEKLVRTVYQQTEGNPFFLSEIVRLLVVEGQLERPQVTTASGVRIPEGVREVIGRRLDQLSDECNRILTTASVIGREFSLEALEPLSDMSGDQLLELLDEAMAARVINELPQAVGQYSFVHALIRETLYDEISTARRVRFHRRIGETLEQLYGNSPDSHLTELAYHFFQASPAGNGDKAIDYAIRAARRATTLLAYEEAAGHYEHARVVIELQDEVDQEQRGEMSLALGEAYTKAGNNAKAREAFLQAADIARKRGAPEQLARAALDIGMGMAGSGKVDEIQVSMLKEALSALSEEDSALRVRLLAQLSLALYYSPELRDDLNHQALEMARRVDDAEATVAALYGKHLILEGTPSVEERLAVATEILGIAERGGNKEMELQIRYRRILDLMELAEMPAVDAEIEAYARLAEELRQPRYLWLTPFLKGSRALLEGRFEECAQLARQAIAIGQRAQDPTAPLMFETLINVLRMVQGQVEDREQAILRYLENFPEIPSMRATLANLYFRLGRRDDAQREFDQVAAHDFATLPRDTSWVVTMANLAYVCSYINDVRRAAILYDQLLPYAPRQCVIGGAAIGTGSILRFLGILATTLSRWEDAVAHFEGALLMNARIGAIPFGALTQQEYGAMLLKRGEPGDREKAHQILDQALAIGKEIGMQGLIRDVNALKSQ